MQDIKACDWIIHRLILNDRAGWMLFQHLHSYNYNCVAMSSSSWNRVVMYCVLKVCLLSYHFQENQTATIFFFGRSCTSTSPISKKIIRRPKLLVMWTLNSTLQIQTRTNISQWILVQLSTVLFYTVHNMFMQWCCHF